MKYVKRTENDDDLKDEGFLFVQSSIYRHKQPSNAYLLSYINILSTLNIILDSDTVQCPMLVGLVG